MSGVKPTRAQPDVRRSTEDIVVGQRWTCNPPDYTRTVEIVELSVERGGCAFAKRVDNGSNHRTKLSFATLRTKWTLVKP